MRYITVPKNKFLAINGSLPAEKKVSFWNFSKWPEWWESGAKSLEKSGPGKIVTAPIRLPEAVIDATTGTLRVIPKAVDRASLAIPIIAVAVAVAGAGFLIVKFDLVNKIKSLKH